MTKTYNASNEIEAKQIIVKIIADKIKEIAGCEKANINLIGDMV